MKRRFCMHREPLGFWVRLYLKRLAVAACLLAIAAWAVWLSFENARVRRAQETISLVSQVGGNVLFSDRAAPAPFRWLPPTSWETAVQRPDFVEVDVPGAVILGSLAKGLPYDVDSLTVNGSLASDGDLRELQRFTNLQVLNLFPANRVTDDGAAVLAELSELRVLNVGRSKITDSGLQSVGKLTELRVLVLGPYSYRPLGQPREKRITSAGLSALAPLSKLEELNLQDTDVDDDGLRHLAKLTELRSLDLRGTNVSDAGLKHLHGLVKLEFLLLTGSFVSAEGDAELSNVLPGCTIAN